jgi:hypothetical protein
VSHDQQQTLRQVSLLIMVMGMINSISSRRVPRRVLVRLLIMVRVVLIMVGVDHGRSLLILARTHVVDHGRSLLGACAGPAARLCSAQST